MLRCGHGISSIKMAGHKGLIMRSDIAHVTGWRFIAVIFALLCGTGHGAIAAEGDDHAAVVPSVLSPDLIVHINCLYAKDPLERHKATQALAEMGPKAASAAPFLVSVLSDQTVLIVPDRTVLGQHPEAIAGGAHNALVAIGSASVPALQAAIRSSPDAQTRALAARAMHRIIFGPHLRGRTTVVTRYKPDEGCIDLWLAAIKDSDDQVRIFAARGLSLVGPASAGPALLKALEDESEGVQLAALKGLGRLKNEAAVGKIIPLLGHKTLDREAQQALEQIGAPAVAVLIAVIADKDAAYRDRAGWTLYGIRDPAALPALHAALGHDDALVRDWVAKTLAGIGDGSSLAPLIKALRDTSPDVRSSAGWAIGSIKAEDKSAAVPSLIDVLKNDKSWEARQSASSALGRAGTLKAGLRDDVVNALTQAMNQDDNKVVRDIASKALERLNARAGGG